LPKKRRVSSRARRAMASRCGAAAGESRVRRSAGCKISFAARPAHPLLWRVRLPLPGGLKATPANIPEKFPCVILISGRLPAVWLAVNMVCIASVSGEIPSAVKTLPRPGPAP